MTPRFFALLGSLCFLLISALSLGGQVFYLLVATLLAVMLYAGVSVLLAVRRLEVVQSLSPAKLERGGKTSLTLETSAFSFLPVAPVLLTVALPKGEVKLPLGGKRGAAVLPFQANHVGVFAVGAAAAEFSDVFGLIKIKKKLKLKPCEAVSLPCVFPVEALKFPPQEEGRAMSSRSTEDITSPEDLRAYREGDSLKRIHWKLSQRQRELVVRRFEMPSPPDTLVLMDCLAPVGGKTEEENARLRDTLCETALSVALRQMKKGSPVRLPLYGVNVGEFYADSRGSLELLKEELAYQLFLGGRPFDKVLQVEMRRMRRTGAAVIITTRMDASVVEAACNIRSSGPNVRFYYVTFHPDDEEILPCVSQLQQRMAEVCYVTPA